MPISDSSSETIFFAALEKGSAEERVRYLVEACGGDTELRSRVEHLLSVHGKVGVLDAQAETTGQGLPPDPPAALTPPGTVIGRYKLLEPIGEGGYGTVFMAEQTTPVQRKVALKIIKAGMDTRQVVARFEAERQALALMDHPNIAKVFDAGVTDAGRPYFVMELVKGVPITKYCDEHRLPPRARLQLFVQVCQAVQHAHQKGIIHRDLKPTNVLVALYDGKPVPKVIDFGVAKATGQRLTERTMFTGFGDVIGTLEYMSPEQAELNQLDVDTRSDIYSLGVMLYELLTGSTPLEKERIKRTALLEALRFIREEEPPRPSTRLSAAEHLPSIAASRGLEPKKLSGLVHGELDWIVMKSLEKDRARRYETANGMASDVQRYLDDEPVHACPPSTGYKLRKFAHRYRGTIATAVAMLGILVLGTTVSVWQAIRASHAAQIADAARLAESQQRSEAVRQRTQAEANERKALAEATKSKQVAEFLTTMFNAPSRYAARGRDMTVLRELIDRGVARMETDLGGQPEVEAELLCVLGFTYWSLREHPKSEAVLRRAVELSRKSVGDEHLLTARALAGLALELRDSGRIPEAEAMYREALAIRRKLLGSEHADVANTLRDLGLVLSLQHKGPDAEKFAREALSLRRKIYSSDHYEVADSLHRLSYVLPDAQIDEKEALAREAVAMMRRLAPKSDDILLATTLSHLAGVLRKQGKQLDAERAARESLDTTWRAEGVWSADTLHLLVSTLYDQGKNEAIKTLFNEIPIPETGRTSRRANLYEVWAKILRDECKADEAEALQWKATSIVLVETERERAAKAVAAATSGGSAAPRPAAAPSAGEMLARRQDFRGAAAEFAKLLEKKPWDSDSMLRMAVLLAESGDGKAYAEHCRRILGQSAGTTDFVARRVSMACLLAPLPATDTEVAARFADAALATGSGNAADEKTRVQSQFVKALAEYRRGNFQAALEWAQKTRTVEAPDAVVIHEAAHSLIAMAEHKLHRTDDARAALGKASAACEARWFTAERTELGDDWVDVLLSRVLLSEARAVVGAP